MQKRLELELKETETRLAQQKKVQKTYKKLKETETRLAQQKKVHKT
jgi:hypothetical protein